MRKAETYTDIPFEGIAGYQRDRRTVFDRRQLTDILEAAGLSACHFYYPMPDYEKCSPGLYGYNDSDGSRS